MFEFAEIYGFAVIDCSLCCNKVNIILMTVVGSSSPCQWQAPTVSVKFLSAVQAVIQWKSDCRNAMPDQWMITLTRTVEKRKKKKETSELCTVYFYTLDGRTSKQKLPVSTSDILY